MGHDPADNMLNELRILLTRTIAKASNVTSHHGAWNSPRADSPAGKELAAQEARRPPPQPGSWPWLLAPTIARLALQVAAEEAKAFCAALNPAATCTRPTFFAARSWSPPR
jgi:hypothetical protein